MTDPVLIIWAGAFGKAVADDLGILRTDCISASEDDHELHTTGVRMHVLVAWRPVAGLCERLDEMAHSTGRPFLPLIVEGPILRLGPLVIPGEGSCWNCWMRRSQQHDAWPDRRAALLQHYSTNPAQGPQGYLRPFATMAAARVSQTIDALDAGSALGGYIWQVDMMSRDITTSIVVGVHDCPRCGLHRCSATRSFAEMQEKLAYLWVHNRSDEK